MEGIRQRVNWDDATIVTYLNDWHSRIERHPGVEHPFLNTFAAEPLDSEATKRLFLEFYYFIRRLPFYIAGMGLNAGLETVLREIAINLYEEVGESELRPHLDIYREFLSAIGIDNDTRDLYECAISTSQADLNIRRLYTESNIVVSLGAMYALETMSSRMVGKLNRGLSNYGYSDAVRFFFTIHEVSEVGHSNGVFNAALPLLTDENAKRKFEDGILEFMETMHGFWDGIAVVCGDALAV